MDGAMKLPLWIRKLRPGYTRDQIAMVRLRLDGHGCHDCLWYTYTDRPKGMGACDVTRLIGQPFPDPCTVVRPDHLCPKHVQHDRTPLSPRTKS